MGYELRALVASTELIAMTAARIDAPSAPLSQGLALLPVTDDVLDGLGRVDERPFGEAFWFLSGGIASLGALASRSGPVAYLEADFAGGAGLQAAVVWAGGDVVLGPVTIPVSPLPAQPDWPVNQALRRLGASGTDEFAAIGLDRHRHTRDWADAPADEPVLEVFWRPGCPFCSRLRRGMDNRGIPATWRDIWSDDEAREIVRRANNGNETVPTVRLGTTTMTNPRSDEVADLLADRTGWTPPAKPKGLLERLRGR